MLAGESKINGGGYNGPQNVQKAQIWKWLNIWCGAPIRIGIFIYFMCGDTGDVETSATAGP